MSPRSRSIEQRMKNEAKRRCLIVISRRDCYDYLLLLLYKTIAVDRYGYYHRVDFPSTLSFLFSFSRNTSSYNKLALHRGQTANFDRSYDNSRAFINFRERRCCRLETANRFPSGSPRTRTKARLDLYEGK